MYEILSGKYDTYVDPRVTRERSYVMGAIVLSWRKVDQIRLAKILFYKQGS